MGIFSYNSKKLLFYYQHMIKNDAEKVPEIYFLKMKDIEEKLHIFIDKQDEVNESLIIFNDYLADQNIF